MAEHDPSKPEWGRFLAYGSGDFALNLFWQGTGFYLFFFYTNVMGIGGTTVGTIFLIASIWDAISDPMMGYIAERTKSRAGAYRPYLLWGAVPLATSFVLMFTPLDLAPGAQTNGFCLGILLLFRTCYTVVSIPYASLGARVTRNSDARTKLTAVRMYFGFMGGISISVIGKQLQASMPDTEAFPLMALAAGLIAIMVLIICFKATNETESVFEEVPLPLGGMEILRSILKNGPFFALIGGIILVTVANTIIGQTILYYFEYLLGNRDAGNTAIVIMTMVPLGAIPFWSFIALRYGKRNAWIGGSLLATVGLGLIYLDNSGAVLPALFEIAIVALGISAYAVLFWSMLPDTIEYGEYKTGLRNESQLIGVGSSFQKISIGLSTFALGLMLDAIGHQPGGVQSPAMLAGLKNIFTLIPAGALLGSALLICFYPLTAAVHGRIISAMQAAKGRTGA